MQKETIKIVIIGHVDHGKSTLIGRLLFDTNSLPKEKIAEIKKISRELGKDTELAFLTDQLKEERERRVTIDTTQIFFKTRKRNYVIIDAPGHVEFIKNMITGASFAEVAVLMVDVQEGVMAETRRHTYLVKMLGLNKIIIVFNKMDLVNYKKEIFEKVKTELSRFLATLGVNPSFILPASTKRGDNISRISSKMPWYQGPCLLRALDVLQLNRRTKKRPLRYPVQDVYEVDGERIAVGKVVSGMVKEGESIVFLPDLQEARVKKIKIFGQHKKFAEEKENIGLIFDRDLSIKRGKVIVQKEEPPKPTSRFRGNIFWMSNKSLEINKTVTLRCATQEVECIAEKIEERINPSTLELIEENAKELKLNESGTVIFRTKKPIVVEKFSFIEELGRFVIEHEYTSKGAGVITDKISQ